MSTTFTIDADPIASAKKILAAIDTVLAWDASLDNAAIVETLARAYGQLANACRLS